jgi:hypothetical protein
MIFSLKVQSVLIAMIAGTLQPNHIKSGVKDFQLKPNFDIRLSSKNAVLEVYPLSCSIFNRKNKIKIGAKKINVAPTQPIIQSRIKD